LNSALSLSRVDLRQYQNQVNNDRVQAREPLGERIANLIT